MITISRLVQQAHATAVAKGWYDSQQVNVPEKIALIHSEASEALEDYRGGHMVLDIDETGKPTGFPVELADIVIRVADLAGAMGIDLESIVELKLAYNKTRPHRHGGKRV